MMDIEKTIKELTLEEKAGLCSGEDFWHTKEVKRLDIPSVFMCDGPHGLRKQNDKTDMMGIYESVRAICYPSASALAASFDRNVMAELGEGLGKACQSEGVGMLLGPGLNIKRSPLCGRNFEYFSEDPYLTGEMASAYVKSIQSQGVAACAKHFACNNQETRRMSGSSEVDERALHEIYLAAFEKVVKEGGVRSLMCAYNAVNGTFCAENRELLTDILRTQWGYKGMVVTDWGAVKNRVKGLEAGLDLEMPGGQGAQDQKIVDAVKSGELKEETLDQAVRNVLQFADECQRNQKRGSRLHLREEHEKAAWMETQCAVLLKNDRQILPLKKECRTVFIGAFADTPRYQGSGSSRVNAFQVSGAYQTALNQGMPVRYAKGYPLEPSDTPEEYRCREEVLIQEAVEEARKAEAAVIFAGLPDTYESEGADRTTLDIPEIQNRLIEAVAAVQKNCIVVLHAGAPVLLPWRNKVKAILNLYLGGEGVGEAAVSLLYGDSNPSGKLAETYPLKLSDNPSYLNFPGEDGIVHYRESVFVGYRYYDKKELETAYPFGHGLSYTTFGYCDLEIGRERMTDMEQTDITVRIKNTGTRKGKEAVQLYIRPLESKAIRPIRELKGFEKIELEPGEEKQVAFHLDKQAFAYYCPEISDWYTESGDYLVEIGASSRDIRLTGKIRVDGTVELPVHLTMTSAMSQLIRYPEGKEFVVKMLRRSQGLSDISENAEDEEKEMEMVNQILEHRAKDMPISSLVTYGAASPEETERLLQKLNQDSLSPKTV